MTPTDHARLKKIFAQAVDLPLDERETFVRERCVDSPLMTAEILSLLSYHRPETIMGPVEGSSSRRMVETNAADQSEQARSHVVEARQIDPHLVLNDVWQENRQILRRRLMAIAYVMTALVAFSLVRLVLMYDYPFWRYAVRTAVLAISVSCAMLLHHKRDLSLRSIRVVEWVVMANVGALVILNCLRLLLESAADLDVATLVSINNWNSFYWALIIFVYGIFMPNTWQRAAAVVLPIAFIPGLVVAIANRIDPNVISLLAEDKFGRPIPAPLVAACIAIYAAHLIHGARLSAFQARRLAQYRLGKMIGEGAMGQVFEAEHMLLKRSCAIKLIQPEHCLDDRALQRFEREVRATAKLTHPHTIAIYDCGQTKDDVFFFAMELLPGLDLKTMVQNSGPMLPARAIHFLVHVAGALEEAHEAGLVHRDVKPANIFSSQRGGIDDFTKLLDFGVVRELKIDPTIRSETNTVAGTPAYMSPEQIMRPASVDGRTDVYAVGAVAFFLLTGRPPLDGRSPMETMLAQINQQPVPPSDYQAGIPTDLESVIMRCLIKDPTQRTASARQLREELQRCDCANDWTPQDASAWWKINTSS